MKAGLTIEELATEVMRQKDAKADYIVNTSMLAMEHCGTGGMFYGTKLRKLRCKKHLFETLYEHIRALYPNRSFK